MRWVRFRVPGGSVSHLLIELGYALVRWERALAVARKQHAKSWELRAGDEHGAAVARSGQAG